LGQDGEKGFDRVSLEKDHAQVLLRDPEGIWGWSTPAGRLRAQRRARLIIEAGDITSDSVTLEIGCGTGVFTQLVSKSGGEIIACELSELLLSRARERSFDSKVDFINEDAAQLGAEHEERYDVVWGSSVLHHLELKTFLGSMLRFLRPGGRFVFAEPNMLNPQIWLQGNIGFVRRMVGDSPCEMAFNRWGITKQLLAAGYNNVTVKPHEFLHPRIPQRFISVFQSVSAAAERCWPICEIAGSLLIRAEKPEK
jgi:SAM-dependent methyltransferase